MAIEIVSFDSVLEGGRGLSAKYAKGVVRGMGAEGAKVGYVL